MGAGHHVYADKYEKFNDTVNTICQFTDEYKDTEGETDSKPKDGSPSPTLKKPVPGIQVSNTDLNLPINPGDKEIDTKKHT